MLVSVQPRPLIKSSLTNAIRIQNILQSYDAFQFVHVGAANNGKDIQLGDAHTLQRKMKRVVDVKVRKIT